MRNKIAKNETKVGRLYIDEIERAEMEWVKCAQKGLQDNSDCKKYKDQLVNKNDILACKGRLELSELEISRKRPIILPKNDRFTERVVMDCHRKVHQCKVSATLAELRARFSVTKGEQYVKGYYSAVSYV